MKNSCTNQLLWQAFALSLVCGVSVLVGIMEETWIFPTACVSLIAIVFSIVYAAWRIDRKEYIRKGLWY